jgi:uncharacterized protein
MLMIQDRNLTSHTYNRSTADAIACSDRGQLPALLSAAAKHLATTPGGGRVMPLSHLQLQPIAGIPEAAQQRLIQLLAAEPQLEAVWLFGSRAMGRHQQSSDIDLCLEAPELSHHDRLRLMAAIDDLLLPWSVDLALRHELPEDLEQHVQRVGQCIWRKP